MTYTPANLQQQPNRPRYPRSIAPAIDAIPYPAYYVDTEGVVRYVNRAARDRFGNDFAPGRDVTYLLSPGHFTHPDGTPLSAEENPFYRSLRGESCRSARLIVRRRAGGNDPLHVVVDSSPIYSDSDSDHEDGEERVAGVLVVVRLPEEETVAAKDRAATILEKLPAGVYIAEGEPDKRTMRWIYINPVGQQQITAPTVTPGVISETFTATHPDGTPYREEELPLQHALWSDDTNAQMEIVFNYHDGTQRYFLATTNLLREENGTREIVESLQDVTELRRLEEAVRRSADNIRNEYEQLATLVSNVDVALALFDTEGRVTLANEAWLKFNRRTAEETLGKRVNELADSSEVQYAASVIDRALATGEQIKLAEFRLPGDRNHHDNGTDNAYVEWSLLPLKDAKRQVTGLLSVTLDVTSRVLARRQLEAQKALLETTLEGVPVGIAFFDLDMRLVNHNAEWASMNYLPSEDLRGRLAYDILPEMKERRELHMRALQGEGVDASNILTRDPRTGEIRYLNVHLRPVRNSAGQISGILSATVDLTDESHARMELEAQRTLLQTVIETTPVGIGMYNRDLRLVTANAEWARLIGCDLETARGAYLYDLGLFSERRREAHRRALAGEEIDLPNEPYEHPLTGETIYLDMRFRPVRSAAGEVIAILSALVDVTERRRLEEQKDEFIGLASHELKTPITAIKGFAQIGARASARLGDERLEKTMRVVNEQADRLTRLVNELLDVTRLQTGRLDLHLESFDLCDLVSEVVKNTALTMPEFEVDLQVPREPLIVKADRLRIEQVITNLTHNAMKYSGNSRRISVLCRSDEHPEHGRRAVVVVHDYGIGIPADQQAHVFSRFFRGSNVETGAHSGLGLGLFISHDIVERHGGQMWLESEVGEGSTFYFALPQAVEGAGS